MSTEKIVRTVAGRLSLREPQTVSLERLHMALESVPGLRDSKARSADELKAMQETLMAEFPKLTDFERDFPSLCFAVATGFPVQVWQVCGALFGDRCIASLANARDRAFLRTSNSPFAQTLLAVRQMKSFFLLCSRPETETRPAST